jgi:hypothetical protein
MSHNGKVNYKPFKDINCQLADKIGHPLLRHTPQELQCIHAHARIHIPFTLNPKNHTVYLYMYMYMYSPLSVLP